MTQWRGRIKKKRKEIKLRKCKIGIGVHVQLTNCECTMTFFFFSSVDLVARKAFLTHRMLGRFYFLSSSLFLYTTLREECRRRVLTPLGRNCLQCSRDFSKAFRGRLWFRQTNAQCRLFFQAWGEKSKKKSSGLSTS